MEKVTLQWYNGKEWINVSEWANAKTAWFSLGNDNFNYRIINKDGNVIISNTDSKQQWSK